jgi:hypothetical protein
MKKYVIYRTDLTSGKEVYVDMYQSLKSTLIEITDFVDEAKGFATAREAYEWAKTRNLDYWHVGRR